MSEFKVDVRQISKIYPHSNADRLELANVSGLLYQFCVGKGQYQVGDKVVFFPIDSVIPTELVSFLGNEKFLSKGVRVKTVLLRKEISQGYVHPLQDLINGGWMPNDVQVGDDVTEALGVTKYEPPVVFTSNGNLLPLPSGVSVYDVEGVDRFPDALEELLQLPVIITEKLEGTNISITVTEDGDVFVNQKNYSIEELNGKENTYWKAAREQGLIDLAFSLLQDYHMVTLRGELCGTNIQGNIYGLSGHKIWLYDVQLDGVYLDKVDAVDLLSDHFVPVLSRGITLENWLNGKTVQEASNGYSVLNPKQLREGIVITPMYEVYSNSLHGRLQLKHRSLLYLAGSEL